MDLKTYLAINKIPGDEFAKRAKINVKDVIDIINKKLSPGKKIAKKIKKASNNAVKLDNKEK